MMTLVRTLAIACPLLLIQPLSAVQSDEFATSFCPECWSFLRAEGAIAKDGICLACGKVAIGIDAADLRWTLCRSHDVWHERPCFEDGPRSDSRVRVATAIVVSPGDERLALAAYCPECRSHPDPMKMEKGRCPSCAGPLVSIMTLEPTWIWCSHRLHWSLEPCPGNSERHCCTPRRGTLPAKIRGEATGTAMSP